MELFTDLPESSKEKLDVPFGPVYSSISNLQADEVHRQALWRSQRVKLLPVLRLENFLSDVKRCQTISEFHT